MVATSIHQAEDTPDDFAKYTVHRKHYLNPWWKSPVGWYLSDDHVDGQSAVEEVLNVRRKRDVDFAAGVRGD